MQAFGRQFIWRHESSSQQTSGENSDSDDAQDVERLVAPYEPQPHKVPFSSQWSGEIATATSTSRDNSALRQATTSSFVPPPIIALNNVPVSSFSTAAYANPQVYSETNIPSRQSSPAPNASIPLSPISTTDLNLALITPGRQRERTSSPRGSKRNSPQPSPEKYEDTQTESGASKIRLVNVNIPDRQKDALIDELRQHITLSNNLLQRFEKDLTEIKANAMNVKELAERAEKRAISSEKVLENECSNAELRMRKFESELKEELSKKIHEAERRAEATLKSMKNAEQIRPAHQVDTMIVDQPQSGETSNKGKKRAVDTPSQIESPMANVRAPPRFSMHEKESEDANQPTASSSVPKPVSFKRPKSSGKPTTIPPPNNTFLHVSDSDDDSSSSSDAPRRKRPGLNISDLDGEEMLKLLLSNIGVEMSNASFANKSGRRRAHPDFKEPARKTTKARGKQNLMNWIRKHLHFLVGIEKSRDILNFASEIYASNTPLQRHMEQWEKTKEGEAPKVKPMKINWNNFDGPWNTHLCELFVQYCADEGLGEGNPSDEIQEFVAQYFWDRLVRLRRIIKKSRPKNDETVEQTSARTDEQHLQALSVARRNSRRNQKHHDRIDICLENLPENVKDIVTDEQRDWKTKYDVLLALGPEGMSSDETDENESDTYWVRKLSWRSGRATQVMIAIDDAKNTTNGYGNIRPGNRPRNRKRKKNAADTARKVPTGKPKNLYDPDWYRTLAAGNKRALRIKSDIEFEEFE